MDVCGYAVIRKGAKGVSSIPLEKFYDNRVRVMEFALDGGVLAIDSEAQGMGMFERADVLSSFKCESFLEVIMPPNLSMDEKMIYYGKCMMRKGGYNNIVRELVIAASLHRKEFCDSFLWSKQ